MFGRPEPLARGGIIVSADGKILIAKSTKPEYLALKLTAMMKGDR